jgi:hypothetical protein
MAQIQNLLALTYKSEPEGILWSIFGAKKKDGNAKHAYCRVVCSQSSKQAAPGGGDWGLLLPAAASHRERHAFAVAETRCFVRVSKLS